MVVDYIVNSIYNSRTYYIISGDGKSCWLVDCGDVETLIDKLPDGCKICGVFLTHTHFDHIYGLPRLLSIYPMAKVVTNVVGLTALANAKVNMSKYHECPIEISPLNPVVCKECDTVELFDGLIAKIYDTPGHNPSCLTYEINGHLFTGDAYIPGVKIVTNLPGGDKALADVSVHRILTLAEGLKVCPGHEI